MHWASERGREIEREAGFIELERQRSARWGVRWVEERKKEKAELEVFFLLRSDSPPCSCKTEGYRGGKAWCCSVRPRVQLSPPLLWWKTFVGFALAKVCATAMLLYGYVMVVFLDWSKPPDHVLCSWILIRVLFLVLPLFFVLYYYCYFLQMYRCLFFYLPTVYVWCLTVLLQSRWMVYCVQALPLI